MHVGTYTEEKRATENFITSLWTGSKHQLIIRNDSHSAAVPRHSNHYQLTTCMQVPIGQHYPTSCCCFCCLTTVFPGEAKPVSSPSASLPLLQKSTFEDWRNHVLWAVHPSCHSTISVKALHKALTLTSGLVSSFLHHLPDPDSSPSPYQTQTLHGRCIATSTLALWYPQQQNHFNDTSHNLHAWCRHPSLRLSEPLHLQHWPVYTLQFAASMTDVQFNIVR